MKHDGSSRAMYEALEIIKMKVGGLDRTLPKSLALTLVIIDKEDEDRVVMPKIDFDKVHKVDEWDENNSGSCKMEVSCSTSPLMRKIVLYHLSG